jgi:hypothetical protein
MGLFDNDGRGFDRVELAGINGEVRKLSRAQFDALPLDQRVRAILNKQLRFFRGDKEIPMRDALADR